MLKIQKTTDYSQFKFIRENRDTAPKHLLDSIQKKNMLEEHPIICDIHMNVIDGQNRLKAAELLKLPIFYLVSENVTADDIGICQVQKPWLMADFLRFYKEKSESKEDYRFVSDIIQMCSLPIHFVVYCCNQSGSVHKEFREGKFVIKKDKADLKRKFGQIQEIIALFTDIKRNAGESELNISSRVQRALWSFINKDDYDHNRMIRSIEKYPSNIPPILNFNSEKMIGTSLFDRVYNFKCKRK